MRESHQPWEAAIAATKRASGAAVGHFRGAQRRTVTPEGRSVMTKAAGLHRIGLSVAVCAALVLVAPAGEHSVASRISPHESTGLPLPTKALISRTLGGGDRSSA
jgi:hypothetical protein